nr:hypothetical protein [Pseudomonas sp. BIGb0427]
MSEFFLALVSAALINNLVLHQGLAIDPLLRSDTDPDRRQVHALGLATLVSLVVAVGLGQLIYHLALLPLQLGIPAPVRVPGAVRVTDQAAARSADTPAANPALRRFVAPDGG